MSSGSVGAVLFAKDHRAVAEFYLRVIRASVLVQDDHHTLLDLQGFRLVISQIPNEIAQEVALSVPPQRREEGALRLDFTVSNIAERRIVAHGLGGQIDDHPPLWAGAGSGFYLGIDPEGNVLGFNAI